jgi:hypothetical protein
MNYISLPVDCYQEHSWLNYQTVVEDLQSLNNTLLVLVDAQLINSISVLYLSVFNV